MFSNSMQQEPTGFPNGTVHLQKEGDGVYIINLKRICEKFQLQLIPLLPLETWLIDISDMPSRSVGQRAVLKLAAAAGATLIAGRCTSRNFTNQIQAAFPKL